VYVGHPDQVLALSEEARALAKRLQHPLSLVEALCNAAIVHSQRAEVDRTRRRRRSSTNPWRSPGGRRPRRSSCAPPPAWRGSGSAKASATPPVICWRRSTTGSPKASTHAISSRRRRCWMSCRHARLGRSSPQYFCERERKCNELAERVRPRIGFPTYSDRHDLPEGCPDEPDAWYMVPRAYDNDFPITALPNGLVRCSRLLERSEPFGIGDDEKLFGPTPQAKKPHHGINEKVRVTR